MTCSHFYISFKISHGTVQRDEHGVLSDSVF